MGTWPWSQCGAGGRERQPRREARGEQPTTCLCPAWPPRTLAPPVCAGTGARPSGRAGGARGPGAGRPPSVPSLRALLPRHLLGDPVRHGSSHPPALPRLSLSTAPPPPPGSAPALPALPEEGAGGRAWRRSRRTVVLPPLGRGSPEEAGLALSGGAPGGPPSHLHPALLPGAGVAGWAAARAISMGGGRWAAPPPGGPAGRAGGAWRARHAALRFPCRSA